MATDNRQRTYKIIHSLGELQSNIYKASFAPIGSLHLRLSEDKFDEAPFAGASINDG